MPGVPGSDQGQGRERGEVRQAQLPPRRAFIDQLDFDEQLAEWNATIADLREHGTTHERPIDRFERERAHLIDTRAQPSFRSRHAPRALSLTTTS